VLDDFSGTEPAVESEFFLGKIFYDEGDFDQATEHLNSFNDQGENKMLLAATARMLADIKIKNGNVPDAIKIIRKAINKTSLVNQKNSLILNEADLLISIGSIEDARQNILKVLTSENLPTSQKQDAEELLGRIAS